MCGVLGMFDGEPIAPEAERGGRWRAAMTSLARRGPDGSGVWRAPSGLALLGHTRLAIIDPTPRAAQPMTTSDGAAAITFNGEIYNAPALRRELEASGRRFVTTSDTEVLLQGWATWGPAVLDRLRGMYAFAIWDDQSRRLFAAVDHVGMKPLAWKEEHGRVTLASDVDAMRALSGRAETLDSLAARQYLSLGCVPPPRTMWRGVRKLPAGHRLTWAPGEHVRVERYWSPPDRCENVDAPDDEAFAALFDDVVREHLLADVPVGAFLSGGLDSAAVTAAAVRCGAAPRCFTLSMEGEADESRDAAQIADVLGLAHDIAPAGASIDEDHEACRLAYDEPQAYSALLTMVRIARHAAPQVKCVLGGDGGDETFGGYLWQREAGPDAWWAWSADPALRRSADELARRVTSPEADDADRAVARRAFGARSFIHGYVSRVFPGFHPAEARALTPGWSEAFDEDAAASWAQSEDRPGLPQLRRIQRLDLTTFCPASILTKVDRGAMHYSLEVRAPLLDRRLIELGLSTPLVPGEDASDGSESRPMLRRYARDRFGAAWPNRSKQGFSLRVRSELNAWRALADRVNDTALVRDGVLRPDWRSFVPFGDMPRLRLVCQFAAWAEQRLGSGAVAPSRSVASAAAVTRPRTNASS